MKSAEVRRKFGKPDDIAKSVSAGGKGMTGMGRANGSTCRPMTIRKRRRP
jgi:hypothetical protein